MRDCGASFRYDYYSEAAPVSHFVMTQKYRTKFSEFSRKNVVVQFMEKKCLQLLSASLVRAFPS